MGSPKGSSGEQRKEAAFFDSWPRRKKKKKAKGEKVATARHESGR